MIILSLDLSTKSSGWAIFEGQELKKYGCITAGSSNLFKRIDKMISGLEVILQENDIDKVVIEDVFPEDVKHNQNVFNALKYLQGFVLHLLDNYKLTNIEFYTASQWRKRCGIKTGQGIKRESLKPKDIKFVKNQFNLNVNDDEADAICLGFAEVGGTIKEPQVIIDDSGFEFG